MRSARRAAPSSIEYSVWTWRWTKSELIASNPSVDRVCCRVRPCHRAASPLILLEHVERMLKVVRIGALEFDVLAGLGMLEAQPHRVEPLPLEAQPGREGGVRVVRDVAAARM